MLPSLRRQGKDEVFLWLILCDLFQPFCDMTEVSPRFLHFSGIAKKSRRVVDGSHAVPHPVGPGTVLAGNAKVGRDDLLSGDSSQADDDFRVNKHRFVAEIG